MGFALCLIITRYTGYKIKRIVLVARSIEIFGERCSRPTLTDKNFVATKQMK